MHQNTDLETLRRRIDKHHIFNDYVIENSTVFIHLVNQRIAVLRFSHKHFLNGGDIEYVIPVCVCRVER